MRLVSLPMVTQDMVLAQSIYYADCLVLKAGTCELVKYEKRLKNLGVEYIYVEDKESEGIEIPDVISNETRIGCKKVLRQTIDNFADDTLVDLHDFKQVINNVVDEVLYNKDVQVSLNDISAADEYTLAHSVSTTVYSLVLARKLNYSKSMLEKLAIGTLLHDVGKTVLDKGVVFKKERLNEAEYEHVREHARLGYEILRKSSAITELSRLIALTHHERIDGSGYPSGITGEEMHEFSKIAAIADVYDALTSDRCYRKKWPAHKAAEYLIQCAGTQFDTRLVSMFIKEIALFPNGSLVRLSDHSLGLVERQNKGTPLRPVVRVIADEFGGKIPYYKVDLMKELSITIIESEIEIQRESTIYC